MWQSLKDNPDILKNFVEVIQAETVYQSHGEEKISERLLNGDDLFLYDDGAAKIALGFTTTRRGLSIAYMMPGGEFDAFSLYQIAATKVREYMDENKHQDFYAKTMKSYSSPKVQEFFDMRSKLEDVQEDVERENYYLTICRRDETVKLKDADWSEKSDKRTPREKL